MASSPRKLCLQQMLTPVVINSTQQQNGDSTFFLIRQRKVSFHWHVAGLTITGRAVTQLLKVQRLSGSPFNRDYAT